MDFEKEIFSLEEAMQRLQYLEQQKDYVLKYVEGYMLETSSIKDKVRREERETGLKLFFDEMRNKKPRVGINFDY